VEGVDPAHAAADRAAPEPRRGGSGDLDGAGSGIVGAPVLCAGDSIESQVGGTHVGLTAGARDREVPAAVVGPANECAELGVEVRPAIDPVEDELRAVAALDPRAPVEI